MPAPDPFTIAALASLPQALMGTYQLIKGFSDEAVRPKYNIPSAATEALGSAKLQATQTRLPGQSAIEGRLDQATANTLASLERLGDTPTSMINAASRAYGKQLDAETNLGLQAAQQQLRNQDILRNQLGQYSRFQDQEWRMNEYDPFREKAAMLSAMRGAGFQNIAGAGQDIAGTFANKGFVDKLYGNAGNLGKQETSAGADMTFLNQAPNVKINYTPKYGQPKEMDLSTMSVMPEVFTEDYFYSLIPSMDKG